MVRLDGVLGFFEVLVLADGGRDVVRKVRVLSTLLMVIGSR